MRSYRKVPALRGKGLRIDFLRISTRENYALQRSIHPPSIRSIVLPDYGWIDFGFHWGRTHGIEFTLKSWSWSPWKFKLYPTPIISCTWEHVRIGFQYNTNSIKFISFSKSDCSHFTIQHWLLTPHHRSPSASLCSAVPLFAAQSRGLLLTPHFSLLTTLYSPLTTAHSPHHRSPSASLRSAVPLFAAQSRGLSLSTVHSLLRPHPSRSGSLQIFLDIQPEGHKEINDKGRSKRDKGQVDKIHPDRGGTDAHPLPYLLTNPKSRFLQKVTVGIESGFYVAKRFHCKVRSLGD